MNNVYYNNTDEMIAITIRHKTFWRTSEDTTQYFVAPGQGIDVSILGLTKEKPEEK